MQRRMPAFLKYLIVGIFNTIIHAAVFAALQVAGNDQALSNLLAFIVALSFSFMANAWFTFRVPVSLVRYCVFVAGMGSLSASLGYLADSQGWPPPLTVGLFCLVSALLGFVFARWVFTEKRRWIFR
ncbi:GtrA family protein [Pseudomonas sp. CC120222-01a]|uniref:GtrA family protein n=1 Tax=Pseudomonas sp. CC120222-01a TaxID=1378075 RepID=UPI000D8C88B8|nr:GtrA family protein [Pseudomonas sp. CC120222-01a]PVZ41798.1 putative flippase GtrA [Pseudomonas sp. CC120222-01a]